MRGWVFKSKLYIFSRKTSRFSIKTLVHNMSNRYVEFSETGGPEVLKIQTEDIPTPAAGQIIVKNKSIGFNFIDTYFRKGLYSVPLPYRSGGEGAGIVHSVGADVTDFKIGDRVVYLGSPSYTDYAKVNVKTAAKLDESISFDTAAASLLKGLTTQYLIEKIYVPSKNEIVLFHSGAGGVGLIFLQWARSLGAKVITTVSTDEKSKLAKENGAWEVLRYTDDIAARVYELTEGKKVKVVYDSVGKDTFHSSLDSLAQRGLLVSFGNASGAVPEFSPSLLNTKGSLFLTRPSLFHYIENFQEQVSSFFKLVSSGVIKIHVNQRYSLEDVPKLHRDAEARKTSGSTVILP